MAATNLDDVDAHLRQVISNLYMLMVQTHDYQGPGTQSAMTDEIKALIHSLLQLSHTAQRLPTHIPADLIEYVESSRNPDIYTRQFVELVMKYNQEQKGKAEAYADFRDILGREMMSAIPDIRDEVRQVVEATGGNVQH